VDEPALCLQTPSAVSEEKTLNALAVTLDDARACGALAGLHCCAARPFTRMCRAKPDILSFDAHEGRGISSRIGTRSLLQAAAEPLPMG
jgi:hypothetical protein